MFVFPFLQKMHFPLMHCNYEPFDKWSWIGNQWKQNWDQFGIDWC